MSPKFRGCLSSVAALVLVGAVVLAYNAGVDRAPEWVQDVVLAAAVLASFAVGAASKAQRAGPRIRTTGWRAGPSYWRTNIRRKRVRTDPAGDARHE